MPTMALVAKSYTGSEVNEGKIWGDNMGGGIEWNNLPARLTVNNLEKLYEKLKESEADEKAGRVVWLDDAVDEILQNIKNETV
jgi:hypothetical protein